MSVERRDSRVDAREIFLAGVTAADPSRAVREALDANLTNDERAPIGTIIAIGKASRGMARAALAACDARDTPRGIVVSSADDGLLLGELELHVAGHPIPDLAGFRAAERVLRLARSHERHRLALVLISGGASALVPAPASPVTLEDKQETTQLLLRAGASIEELNCVRKHLSFLKGGRLARELSPSPVLALVLSDVIGDDLGVIASGPVSPDPGTFEDALEVLRARGGLERVPVRVRERLEAGSRGEIEDTPKAGDPCFDRVETRIVGSNAISLDAAANAAHAAGYRVEVVSRSLVGEAQDAARRLAAAVRAAAPVSAPLALLAGGETTVTVRGTGQGGRNQELALAFALACDREPPAATWTFLSAGTDGIDGPTDAAGAIVDAGSLARARQGGVDPVRALEANDSHRALDAAGDLLRTGPTGTNVADLQIALVSPVR